MHINLISRDKGLLCAKIPSNVYTCHTSEAMQAHMECLFQRHLITPYSFMVTGPEGELQTLEGELWGQ